MLAMSKQLSIKTKILFLRNVPADVHKRAKERAKLNGMTLQGYCILAIKKLNAEKD